MSPVTVSIIALAGFLILVINRMPIGFAFALVGCVGIMLFKGIEPGLQVIGSAPYAWATSLSLLPLPLFILMGHFAFYSGISGDLYDAAYKWLGRFPGGVALATTLAATGFGACCGSSLAGVATFGAIAYPEMDRLKYDRRLATGCIVAGGSLSSLIPPSCGFIVYAFLTNTSIAKLFIAGIFPGIMQSVFFLLVIYILCRRNPRLGPCGASSPWKEMLISLKGVWGMLLLFLLVMGGMYFGVFTPSEAGAIGAFGALVIALATRRLTFSNFVAALRDTLKTTTFFLTLFIGAIIFNRLLTLAGIGTVFTELLNSLTVSPMLILSIILFIYIPLGMFLDLAGVLMLTIPIFIPALVSLGFDPVYLGVLIMVIVELALITPPVGLNSFVASGVTKVPLEDVFYGIVPFAIVMLVGLVILVAFPQISLFLPNMMT